MYIWCRQSSQAYSLRQGYRFRCLDIFFHFFSKFSEIKCKNLENCLKVDFRFFVAVKREKYVFLDYFAICDELCQIWPNLAKNIEKCDFHKIMVEVT